MLRHLGSRRRAVLALVSVTLAGLLLPGGGVAAAQDPFYEPPSPLPPGEPGDLIRAEPMDAYDTGRIDRLPARAWRVLYRSTSATGRAIAVSGTVLVPHAPYRGERPVVGYSVGTHGIADRCAPSRLLASGGENEARTIRSILERGWAVALTDWEGLGTPGDHTYVIGRAEGHAVLDSIRAARRLEAAGLPPRGPLALIGYSQGGHSTAWAAQLQPGYAPELGLAGVAAGAVPSDLQKVSDHLDGGHAAGLVVYGAIGLNAAYPELQLERYLNAAGRDAIARGRDSCTFDGSLALFSFRRSTEYTTTDVRRLPDWHERLHENRVGALAPEAPVLVYHARRDDLIPYELAEALRSEWCTRGVNVRLREVDGVDHISGTVAGTPGAIAWLADRFASGPPPHPSECRRISARRSAKVRLRFGFPGNPWSHLSRRSWYVHARARGGTLRGLVFTVRDARRRLVGRSAARVLRGYRHIPIRLRRELRPRRRYTLIATGRRPDGSRLRRTMAVRMPERR
jgi:hypothetical protein